MFKFTALLVLLPAVLAMPSLAPRAAVYNVHPNGDKTKCVGVNGGLYVSGAAVDIYDCNGSATQEWSWADGPFSVDPATGAKFCLDIPMVVVNQPPVLTNGVKTIIRPCAQGEEGSPTQSWSSPPAIRLSLSDSTGTSVCLDLTDGLTTNRNPLQIWACASGNPNQVWTTTTV